MFTKPTSDRLDGADVEAHQFGQPFLGQSPPHTLPADVVPEGLKLLRLFTV